MEQAPATEAEKPKGQSRRVRLKRYLVYAVLIIVAIIILYIFVWFGTQLGLQN